ncbi:glycosyltransferase family 9 protein [Flavobacterium sp. JP2137]|uniref:glycosyltransferase family 9 protein n=1 Tax=Flavobacterium sp. JP2137 TaxID=3414510 RepID=UPI003D2FA37C
MTLKKKSHILVFRLSAMGDVAMTVPVIRALVSQHPDVRVTVVSRPFFKPFFKSIPRVDFFAVDVKKRHRGFLGLWRLFGDLKKLCPDFFADFHNVLRSQITRGLFAFTPVKVEVLDKGRAGKKALTRTENKVFEPLPTMFENHAETLRKLGFPIDLKNPQFPTVENMSPALKAITGSKQEHWIGIAPFAQYDTKVYPLDLMQQVIDALAEKEDNKIFLFGGGDQERALLNQLKRDNPQVIVMVGKVKLQEELCLIQHLDVMLSMDSGNAHLAAMLGKKVITLWGGTHPYAGFAPFNQPSDYAITADRTQFPLLPLSVYGNKVIPGYEHVMRSISPETVIDKVQCVLAVSAAR